MSAHVRILGGDYKNRAINFDKTKVRPSLTRARLVIFDILSNILDFSDSVILDGFAGSGIFGIEALSRKAKKVVFFEIDNLVCANIKKNLKGMNFKGSYDVIKTNILVPPKGTNMDLIFLDPPYDKDFIIPKVIKKLKKYNWIGDNTIILLETWKKTKIQDSMLEMNCFKKKVFGKCLIRFFKQ